MREPAGERRITENAPFIAKTGWVPKAKFNMGSNAYFRMGEMLYDISTSGHEARSRFKIKDIFAYFNYIQTMYITLSHVISEDNKELLETNLTDIKSRINVVNHTIRGTRQELVEVLTDTEQLIYKALQDSGMYIAMLKAKSGSERGDMRKHLEGEGIPREDDDLGE
jgi:hypothetical protein